MSKAKILFLITVFLVGTSLSFVLAVSAAAPASLNYQTELKTSDGTPVTSATTVQFSFYNHPTNGSPSNIVSAAGPLLWTERYNRSEGPCAQVTPDGSGTFSLALGSCTPFPDYLDFNDVYYLGIKIEDNSEAAPRLAYSTAPFAVSTGDLTGISFADAELGTSGIFEDDAAVIIGADSGFAYISGAGPGDLRVVDDFEVADAAFIGTNLVVGAATTISETLANAGFALDGDELFVAGNAGIEGFVFSDAGFVVGASTTYKDGDIESSGTLIINDSNNQEIKTGTGLFTVGGILAITGGGITSSATVFNFDIGDTGMLSFRDGTNTLATIKDQGDFGFFNIGPKSTTGNPTTCAVGDIYVNSVDGTINGCTATNTWTTLSTAGEGFATVSLTGSITLAVSVNYQADTSGGAFSVTLPSAPADGSSIRIQDVKGQFGTNNLTINRGGTDTIEGSNSLVLDANYAAIQLFYDTTTTTWTVLNDDIPAPTTLHRASVAVDDVAFTGTDDPIIFDQTLANTGGMVTNSTTITIQQAGKYQIIANTHIDQLETTTGTRSIFVVKNNTNPADDAAAEAAAILKSEGFTSADGGTFGHNMNGIFDLVVGDTLILYFLAAVAGDNVTSAHFTVNQLPSAVVTNVAQAAEYLLASMSASHTPTDNQPVQFNTTDSSSGSSISHDTVNYEFDLKAGKTYRLTGSPAIVVPAAGGESYQWYDETAAASIGIAGRNGDTGGNQTAATAIFTPTVNSSVELRISTGGNGSSFQTTASFALIETIADGTKVAQFTGATSGAAGTTGFVLAPDAGDQGAFLLGNATWSDPNTLFLDTVNNRLGIGTNSPTITLAIGDTDTGFDYQSDGNFEIKSNSVRVIDIDDGNTTRRVIFDVTNALGGNACDTANDVLETDADGRLRCGTEDSDERLKNVVAREILYGLDEVVETELIQYTWNELAGRSMDEGIDAYQGFSGQNLLEVAPQLVFIGHEGYYGVDQNGLIATAWNAIRELNTKVDEIFQEQQVLVLSSESDVLGTAVEIEEVGNGENTYRMLAVMGADLEGIEGQMARLLVRVAALEENDQTNSSDQNSPPEADQPLADNNTNILSLSQFAQLVADGEVLQFTSGVEFMAGVVFHAPVTFSSDQVGTLTIPAGATKVKVTFGEAFASSPIVNLTPIGVMDGSYTLEEVTKEGFIVSLILPIEIDITFNWTAFMGGSAANPDLGVKVEVVEDGVDVEALLDEYNELVEESNAETAEDTKGEKPEASVVEYE